MQNKLSKKPTGGRRRFNDLPMTGADSDEQANGIPPHVWALLQEGGALAAERLRDILASPTFSKFAPSAQRGLIELALTRAYGLPVRKSVSVEVTGSQADAIAASLTRLGGALPEHTTVDVTPDPATVRDKGEG